MDKEERRDLSKAELMGSDHRLVRLVPRLVDPIGGAHTNRQKHGTDHKRVKTPGVVVIGQVIKTKDGWILKGGAVNVRKEEWIRQALKEDLEPASSALWVQLAPRKAVEGLAIMGTTDLTVVTFRNEQSTKAGR